MGVYEEAVDLSVYLTLKEAIRERSSYSRSHGYRHSERWRPFRQLASLPILPLPQARRHRRNLPCFVPRGEIYVVHRELGRVVGIGMGGVCFTYQDHKPPAGELPREGLLFTADDLFLDGLPFEIVADQVVGPPLADKYRLRKRRVHFGELSDGQVERLENFILRNAYIPQLAYS